jgi:hypothetical protein
MKSTDHPRKRVKALKHPPSIIPQQFRKTQGGQMTGPLLQRIQDLRRTLSDAATECDALLYGQPFDATLALQRLSAALNRLAARCERVRTALDSREG